MRIRIAEDHDAARWLEDETFLARWRALAAADPKLTLAQEPALVLAWYRAYADEYAPLLALGYSEEGALRGLVPLARPRGGGAPVHAGAGQAEYHGWVAAPGADEELVVGTLLALREAGPLDGWAWRWLPPGTPLGWTRSPALARAGIHVVLEERPAPVWDLRDTAKLERVLSSRSLRAKANRYRRRGAYRLERVRDIERARALLPRLARQCDFRQEVVNGVRPFADDPRKETFLLERLERPDAVHFSVLTCDDEPLAFHLGACDGRTCVLGLTAYSPAESRNSPGTLLLAELARSLAEDGYHELDLTPGTDAYKQRFANAERVLARPTLHTTRAGRLRSRVVAAARRRAVGALAAGDQEARERGQRRRRALDLAAHALGAGHLRDLARRAYQGLRRRNARVVLTREVGASAGRGPAGVRAQAWEDLLEGRAHGDFASRRALLADALARFSAGERLYTASVDGEVRLAAWRAEGGDDGPAGALRREGVLGEGACLLYAFTDLVREPGARAFEDCLRRVLADCAEEGVPRVVLCLDRRERARREVARGLGFREGPAAAGGRRFDAPLVPARGAEARGGRT